MLQPGWIRTLLPISAHWIAVWAPTLQSLPILTPTPITAPEPITVPAPISTCGPITASGSTITPSSRCAVGSMTADGAMPALPNQDCGRSASPCSARAILTNSRNGWATRKTATWAGTRGSKRALTRQAAALVEASWSAYFRLSKNVRCIGPACSSEARPLICWLPRDGSAKCALVNAAISASVDEGGRSKNVGCAIPPVAVRLLIEPEPRLRSIKTELSLVVLTRFLPQKSLRNRRKLDCYANRHPPPDQVRGHAPELIRGMLRSKTPQNDVPPPNLNCCTRSFGLFVSGTA